MKKLVIKLAVLFFIPAFLFVTLNALYKQTNHWKQKDANTYRFLEVPDDISICNVGSSHGAMGFYWEGFPELAAFNFAIFSQRYYMDYMVLNQFKDHLEPGCIVLIPVLYFQITQHDNSVLRFYQAYYKFLRRTFFTSWDLGDYLKYGLFPILSEKDFLARIISDIPEEQISRFYGFDAFMEGEELLNYAEMKHALWTDPDEDKGEEGLLLNIAEISRIIDFCYEREWIPVLVTLPVTDTLNTVYTNKSPDFWMWFSRFTTGVQSLYPRIPYLDYSKDSRFIHDHTLFADGDHLNVNGAAQFTSIILEDLEMLASTGFPALPK